MIAESLFHTNEEQWIYPVSIKELKVRFRAARGDLRHCNLVIWDRTDDKKKQIIDMGIQYRDSRYDYFQTIVSFSKVARYQKYYFELVDKDGNTGYFDEIGYSSIKPAKYYFEYLYTNNNDVLKTPEWAKGIVYYQIFPERFCNGCRDNDPPDVCEWGSKPTRENYMGGDLDGIIQKVPYLKDLGIECIYLNPIFKGDFNHKYATTDYFEVDPQFGTKETLIRLVNKCHEVNIKVILDGVFNHTGIHFEPFQNLLKEQQYSKYKDWFLIESYPVTISHHSYECVGAYKWMPKLNTSNADVQNYILKVMHYWINEAGIDGWRLDVSDEVDGSLWQRARAELKIQNPDLLLLGETWVFGGRLLNGSKLDSVMNYVFRDLLLDYFATQRIKTSEFDSGINFMLASYRDEQRDVMYNLIDSHDTERFFTSCDRSKKKFKLAVAFQMLFPGCPAIFYGDEIGMDGDNDPDCRKCMEWTNETDQDLLEWYKKLITIKKSLPVIKKGDFSTMIADDQKSIYGFKRSFKDDEAIVLIHNGDGKENIYCPVPKKKNYYNLIGKEKYTAEYSLINDLNLMGAQPNEYVINVEMPAYSAILITL